MTPEDKAAVADPLLEELVLLREAADTKPKIAPVHVLNDVSATMGKIQREVRPKKVFERHISNNSPTAGCFACPHGLRKHCIWSSVKRRPLHPPIRPLYKQKDTDVL